MKSIGMIGIGLMGHGIAANIARHGSRWRCWSTPATSRLDTLKRAGVRTLASAAVLRTFGTGVREGGPDAMVLELVDLLAACGAGAGQ